MSLPGTYSISLRPGPAKVASGSGAFHLWAGQSPSIARQIWIGRLYGEFEAT